MIEVRGADQFARLGKALKDAGNKDLQRELNKALNQAAKPFKQAAARSAMDKLPTTNRLDQRVARSPIRVRKSLSGRNAQGIRIQAGGKRSQLAQLNQGRFRHPVFGNREVWVTQQVPAGWWDEPARELGPQVTAEARRALERVVTEVERRARR